MTSMHFIFILIVGLALAYLIDQKYYGGTYSRPTIEMLQHIVGSYK